MIWYKSKSLWSKNGQKSSSLSTKVCDNDKNVLKEQHLSKKDWKQFTHFSHFSALNHSSNLEELQRVKSEGTSLNWSCTAVIFSPPRQHCIKNRHSLIADITTRARGLPWETFVKHYNTELHSHIQHKTLPCKN